MTPSRSLWPAALLAASACAGDPLRDYFVDRTPRERYVAGLEEADLAETALARDWIAAGERALTSPTGVVTPYREAGYFDPAEPRAEAYRLPLRRGQKLAAALDVRGDGPLRAFLDVLVLPEDARPRPPVLLAAAESGATAVEYVARRDGIYLLRVQPELLRGGRYILTVEATASLEFPVLGRDTRNIRSGFGAPREAGRRQHHGVDIFAPRGTPVLAAAAGRVRRTGTNRLGGKVVWLRDEEMGHSLYYAHLDSQTVRRGQLVRPGDTVGFVGNTGNARTTPPHLHFGIYARGTGPVDPFPFLDRSDVPLPPVAALEPAVGAWIRVSAAGAPLHAEPRSRTAAVATLERHTPLRVLAVSGSWYRAQLPDGTAGFLAARLAEPLASPVRRALVASGALLLHRPSLTAPVIDSLAAAADLPVLGLFGEFAYVRGPSGREGWVVVE